MKFAHRGRGGLSNAAQRRRGWGEIACLPAKKPREQSAQVFEPVFSASCHKAVSLHPIM
jgi:hypothetical protein